MISIAAKALADTVKPLAKIAALTEQHEDAGFVEIQASHAQTYIHAGAHSSYIRQPLEATVETECVIRVHARTLRQLLDQITDTDIVRLAPDDGFVRWQSRRGRYRLRGHHAPLRFLIDPSHDQTNQISVPSESLGLALRRIHPFVPREDARKNLTNASIRVTPSEIQLAATDGKCLIESRVPLASSQNIALGTYLAPYESTQLIADFLLAHNPVRMHADANRLIFTSGASVLSVALTSGEFPPYEQLIPAQAELPLMVEADALAAVVKHFSVIADQDAVPRLAMHMHRDTLSCALRTSSDNEAAEGEMPVRYQGEDFEVALNAKLLRTAVDAFSDHDIAIHHTNNPLKPLLITSAEMPGMRVVVMPMR